MSIVLIDEFASKKKQPTSIAETMTLKNNYYIVKSRELFHYYRITVLPHQDSDNIIRFDKYPPVIREGIVVVENKMYRVSVPDLLRGVIRKSREIEKAKNGSRKATSSGTGTGIEQSSDSSIEITTGAEATVRRTVESGLGEGDEAEILQQANLCWDEQVESLLHSIHKEEGLTWEISDIVQSGPGNEISAVQDPQGGS